jgi:ATP-dependent HslUV protease ATP-binding subunit HslU
LSSLPEALREMAVFAFRVNETTENIGARRLHTIMERVLEEISFLAPDLARVAKDAEEAERSSKAVKEESTAPLPYIERETQSGPEKVFQVTPEYVKHMVATIVKDQDLSRYIL